MTTNCTNNRLSVLSSVLSVVGCYALRPKSLSMPYSCRAYLSTAAQPCKVGRDEYDRMDIENGNTTLKQKNPAVEILLSIRRTRPFRADRLPLYLCTIRNGIRNFACAAFAYNAFRLASSVSLTVGRLLLSMSSTIVPVSSV